MKRRFIWWLIERLEDLIAWLEPMTDDFYEQHDALAEFGERNKQGLRQAKPVRPI